MMLREGKIQFKDYVIDLQITTTYNMEEILFYLFPVHQFAFYIFKNSTLHVLTQNLGILKEAKNENMISYFVIHLTSPFPDFQMCVNLSAALEVSVINNFSEFFHVGWNIGSCWVWILRNGCNCDNSWGAKHLCYRWVQFSGGNNGKSCPTTFLILVRFDMFGEMITPHKSFRTFRTFKSLFT